MTSMAALHGIAMVPGRGRSSARSDPWASRVTSIDDIVRRSAGCGAVTRHQPHGPERGAVPGVEALQVRLPEALAKLRIGVGERQENHLGEAGDVHHRPALDRRGVGGPRMREEHRDLARVTARGCEVATTLGALTEAHRSPNPPMAVSRSGSRGGFHVRNDSGAGSRLPWRWDGARFNHSIRAARGKQSTRCRPCEQVSERLSGCGTAAPRMQ